MVQNLNLEALAYFPIARFIRRSLAVPHFSVRNITKINPFELKYTGFKGLVFDKDNTLTVPYGDEIHPDLRDDFELYREAFRNRIVIMSNSAGTRDDIDYKEACRIERALDIPVLRHNRKKPGGIDAVIEYFRCSPEDLVMFGDRIFTDVVFGNRYGMLTVHTALLTEEGDNKAAAKIRRMEIPYLQTLVKKGVKSPTHKRFNPDICSENLI